MNTMQEVRRGMRFACVWSSVALAGLAVLTVFAADRLGAFRLHAAVDESVGRNTRDRQKSTELIIQNIQDLKRAIEGTPHGRGLAVVPETYTARPVLR